MDKPSGTGGGQRRTETEQLRADLAAARAELDKLTATLREQETSSMRVERARQAWAQTVDALAQPIFMHDQNGCIVRANRAYADRAGVPVTNLIGKVYWKLFPARDSAFAVDDTDNGHTEFEFSLSPDEVFLVRSVGAAAGLPASWRLYIFQDITELKRAEAAIRVSAQYARSIVDSSLATIVAVDRDRRIVEFNPAAERAFGYQREELLGKSINLLYDDPKAAEMVRRIAFERDGLVGEIVNRRKNGELFTSLLSAAILRDADGKTLGIVGTSMNISERKQAEEKLRATLTELELIFDNAAAGIAFARERVIQRVNHRFAEMFGYDSDELVGKTTEILYPTREDYENLGREAYPELAKGGMYQADVQFRRKDGSLFRVHVTGRAISREKGARSRSGCSRTSPSARSPKSGSSAGKPIIARWSRTAAMSSSSSTPRAPSSMKVRVWSACWATARRSGSDIQASNWCIPMTCQASSRHISAYWAGKRGM